MLYRLNAYIFSCVLQSTIVFIIRIKLQYFYLKILHLSIKVKVTVKNCLVFLRKNAFEFAMQT